MSGVPAKIERLKSKVAGLTRRVATPAGAAIGTAVAPGVGTAVGITAGAAVTALAERAELTHVAAWDPKVDRLIRELAKAGISEEMIVTNQQFLAAFRRASSLAHGEYVEEKLNRFCKILSEVAQVEDRPDDGVVNWLFGLVQSANEDQINVLRQLREIPSGVVSKNKELIAIESLKKTPLGQELFEADKERFVVSHEWLADNNMLDPDSNGRVIFGDSTPEWWNYSSVLSYQGQRFLQWLDEMDSGRVHE